MIPTLVVAIVAAILRNLVGWWEKATKDKKITKYEWAELGVTTARVALLAVSAQYALGLDQFASVGSAVILDYVRSALGKRT